MPDSSIITRRRAAPLVGAALAVWHRIGHLIREGLKFAAVGSVGFVLDLAVFNALLYTGAGGVGPLNDRPLVAKTIAVVVATVLTYTGHRVWTFRHRAHTGVAREYALFFVLNAVGLGIALACLAFTTDILGFTGPVAINIANLGGIALGTLFRFWTYRTWVFPAATAEPAAADSDPSAPGVAAVQPGPGTESAEPEPAAR